MSKNVLIVLGGLPASGKSTYAEMLQEINPTFQRVCPDLIRKAFYGDENIQGDGARVFKTAFHDIREYGCLSENVVFDATNINADRRKELVKEMRPYFDNAKKTEEYVIAHLARKQRNLICRRIRLARKANMHPFNYFCTFTYDGKNMMRIASEGSLGTRFLTLVKERIGVILACGNALLTIIVYIFTVFSIFRRAQCPEN